MSQFDFPRINFHGTAYIDPGTANNNYFLPLALYDQINGKAYTPPRLYLEEKYLPNDITFENLITFLPPDQEVQEDEHGKKFIEIHSVVLKDQYIEWATTPLGSHYSDKAFHPLYEMLHSPKTKKKLTGIVPAYWNYYGKMTFGFQSVKITSVEIFNKQSHHKELYHSDSDQSFNNIIGAEVSFEDRFGTDTGVMIDVCPTLSVYSQTFLDYLVLKKEGKTLLKGKPCKGSLRLMNPFRIVNQDSICGSSGSFFSSIALTDIITIDSNPILEIMHQYAQSDRKLKGVFIHYNLFEVIEDRNPDYIRLGESSNPAYCTVMGSFTPWYEEEMKSFPVCRQLIGVNPFLGYRSLTPLLFKLDPQTQFISFDLTPVIPEVNLDVSDPSIDPTFRPQRYETYDLGLIEFMVEIEDGTEVKIGEQRINEQDFSRSDILENGGILDFCYEGILKQEDLEEGTFFIKGISKKDISDTGTEKVLSKETPIVIISDEAGLYANEGDDVSDGYVTYGYPKEKCRLRLFSKGKPLKEPVQLQILEYKVTSSSETFKLIELEDGNHFTDNQVIELPIGAPCNAIYLFTTDFHIPRIDNIYVDLVRTGFFINLRILPNKCFEKYVDENHPEYVDEITFDMVYEEIFNMYDLIYPVSGKISPFNEKEMIKSSHYVKKLMQDDNWNSPSYMPSTREMSESQKKIFLRWVDQMSMDKDVN